MRVILIGVFSLILIACELSENVSPLTEDIWTIDVNYIREGCFEGKDCIQSLEKPARSGVADHDLEFLDDSDLIIGLWNGTNYVAYPHFILDWHEIVNEDGYSVSYCPLTGSAVCFDTDEEFGVSGLLYNNNLIMYDRPTDSYWLQMLLSSVSGDKLGNKLELINSIETTWGIWRKLFPNTLVIDPESDLKNEYHNSPYGNYSTCNTAACRDYIYFPTTSISDRFAAKDRLFAIIGDAEVKAFELAEYASPRLEKLQVDGIDHVVIISSVDNIAVAFETGRDLELKSWDIPNGSIVIAENGSDQTWDITGRTIQGGNSSENLKAANAYIAYWFAIAAFFPEAEITEL